MNQLPKPIAAAAGAGDLAVEKARELSRLAADKLSAMESDPSAVADRMQNNIETRAGSLGTAVRSAQSTMQEQAQELSHRAQSLLVTAVEQAGEAYENLAKRGETVVNQATEGDTRSLSNVRVLRMIKPGSADEQAEELSTGEKSDASTSEASQGATRTAGSNGGRGTTGEKSGSSGSSSGSTARKSTKGTKGTGGQTRKTTTRKTDGGSSAN